MSADAAEPVNLVVRNTFLHAVGGEEQPLASSDRTQSDPMGGRSQQVLTLQRMQPERPRIPETEEADEDERDTLAPLPLSLVASLPAEEEDEDDEPLGRTKSVSNPIPGAMASSKAAMADLGRSLSSASAGLGRSLSSASAGEIASPSSALTRLLTGGGEDETFASAMPPSAGYMGPGYMPPMMPPWGYPPMPFGMQPNMWSMMPPYGLQPRQEPPVPEHDADGDDAEGDRGAKSSAKGKKKKPAAKDSGQWQTQDWQGLDQLLPELGTGPPLGSRHSFHQETQDMGIVSPDFRQFTKVGYEGRLSVISESRVHHDGLQRYLVQFSGGELSVADGVGFIFSQRLPCAKNIQRIVSIFVNQKGQICMRIFADIVRGSAYVKPLELGDWVEMAVDLKAQVCTFNVWGRTATGWPPLTGQPASTAAFHFGDKMSKVHQTGQKPVKLNVGHLACVVKNIGVTVTLFS